MCEVTNTQVILGDGGMGIRYDIQSQGFNGDQSKMAFGGTRSGLAFYGSLDIATDTIDWLLQTYENEYTYDGLVYSTDYTSIVYLERGSSYHQVEAANGGTQAQGSFPRCMTNYQIKPKTAFQVNDGTTGFIVYDDISYFIVLVPFDKSGTCYSKNIEQTAQLYETLYDSVSSTLYVIYTSLTTGTRMIFSNHIIPNGKQTFSENKKYEFQILTQGSTDILHSLMIDSDFTSQVFEIALIKDNSTNQILCTYFVDFAALRYSSFEISNLQSSFDLLAIEMLTTTNSVFLIRRTNGAAQHLVLYSRTRATDGTFNLKYFFMSTYTVFNTELNMNSAIIHSALRIYLVGFLTFSGKQQDQGFILETSPINAFNGCLTPSLSYTESLLNQNLLLSMPTPLLKMKRPEIIAEGRSGFIGNAKALPDFSFLVDALIQTDQECYNQNMKNQIVTYGLNQNSSSGSKTAIQYLGTSNQWFFGQSICTFSIQKFSIDAYFETLLEGREYQITNNLPMSMEISATNPSSDYSFLAISQVFYNSDPATPSDYRKITSQNYYQLNSVSIVEPCNLIVKDDKVVYSLTYNVGGVNAQFDMSPLLENNLRCGNQAWSFLIINTVTNSTTLPQWMTLSGKTISVQSYSNSDAGTYSFSISGSIGGFAQEVNISLNVIIGAVNTAPYFEDDLQNIVLKENTTYRYKLPKIIDDEGDNYRANVYFQDAKRFTYLTPNYVLYFAPTVGDAGEYELVIGLLDFALKPAFSKYSLMVKILNADQFKDVFQQYFLTPSVLQITDKGELSIQFDQAIKIPRNQGKIRTSNAIQFEVLDFDYQDSIQVSNWEISDFNNTVMTIKLKFNNSSLISTGQIPSQLMVTFQNGSYFQSFKDKKTVQQGYSITCDIPQQQQSNKNVTTTQSKVTLTNTIVTATVSNIVLAIVFGVSAKMIWNTLNTIQVIVHLSLIGVAFPDVMTSFLGDLVDVSNFNLIPKDKLNDFYSNIMSNQQMDSNEKIKFMDIFEY